MAALNSNRLVVDQTAMLSRFTPMRQKANACVIIAYLLARGLMLEKPLFSKRVAGARVVSVRLRPITLVLMIGGLLTDVFVLVDTYETGCHGCAEHSFIFRNLREGAERPLEGDALRWNIVRVFRRDDRIRRNSMLHPLVEG